MDWDNARGIDATARAQIEALFAARYPSIQAMRTAEVAGALDLAAYYDVPSASSFSARDRPLAIVHMAAHNLEANPAAGRQQAGGPLQSASTERGSRSYAVAQVGVYVSPADFHLGATQGGRAYMKLRDSKAFSMPCMR